MPQEPQRGQWSTHGPAQGSARETARAASLCVAEPVQSSRLPLAHASGLIEVPHIRHRDRLLRVDQMEDADAVAVSYQPSDRYLLSPGATSTECSVEPGCEVRGVRVVLQAVGGQCLVGAEDTHHRRDGRRPHRSATTETRVDLVYRVPARIFT